MLLFVVMVVSTWIVVVAANELFGMMRYEYKGWTLFVIALLIVVHSLYEERFW